MEDYLNHKAVQEVKRKASKDALEKAAKKGDAGDEALMELAKKANATDRTHMASTLGHAYRA